MRTALHDLRSPIAVIQGFIEVIRGEPWFIELDEDSQDIFNILLRNTHYMVDLVGDLAEMNHLNEVGRSVNVQRVLLKEFVADVVSTGSLLAAKKNIHFFGPNFPPETAEAWFDARRIRQVLDNLITNAIKFSRPGGAITLSVESQPEKLLLSVTDTGLGIPTGELSLLFKDFGKTSVRPTAGESSTGLGLAIARRIVEAHGGQISVESQAGEGSTFAFWIPRRAHQAASSEIH